MPGHNLDENYNLRPAMTSAENVDSIEATEISTVAKRIRELILKPPFRICFYIWLYE
jgi:hypothetical protein